jgi:hypothetical protein
MFCAPELVVSGAECVGSRFHVLRARTHFRRYRGSPVPFSCFALLDSFLAVPRASGPVFMSSDLGLVFGGYRGRLVPFSYFALPDSFSAVLSVSGPVFMFCAPELVSTVLRASGPIFMFCDPRLAFHSVECVGSRFHVLRARTQFRR